MSALASNTMEREFVFHDGDFHFLARLANQRTGIVINDKRKDMVYGRLVRRLRALGLGSFSEYCELLKREEGREEINQLVNAITTNLTSFFREAHHFKHLQESVLQPLIDQKGPRRLRIWSAGCSSGMEAYSIAMVLRATLPDMDKWDVRILATDIDSHMLNVAGEAIYPHSEYEHIPEAYRCFVHTNRAASRLRVCQDVRNLVTFRQLNLLDGWPMQGPFDLIFCRNVVIYFDKLTKQKLFSRYADILKPDGWLYIGHSENLNGITDRFRPKGRTIYQKG